MFGRRLWFMAIVIVLSAGSLLADTIFNFDNVPAGQVTPFSDSQNGIVATFTAIPEPDIDTDGGVAPGWIGPEGLIQPHLASFFERASVTVWILFSIKISIVSFWTTQCLQKAGSRIFRSTLLRTELGSGVIFNSDQKAG
jgi:hypothetical protein